MSNPAVVFVIDDDGSVRKALSRLLRSAGYEVETFASAYDFLNAERQSDHPACLILDVQLPRLNGIDLQRKLQAVGGRLPIIFITGHGSIPMSVSAMKSGAVDFLPKPFSDKSLLRAVEQALARSSRAISEATERQRIEASFSTLTPRQREVMELVVKGLLNKQVAAELGTVEKTVKVHRAQVMEKMRVQSLAELVRVAEKIGIPAQQALK
jgi:RNA polymerase sigma factor (sigma-70 family)